MARTCAQCGKTITVANNRSHSNQATKRIMYPNLQGSKRLARWCTRCRRTKTRQGTH